MFQAARRWKTFFKTWQREVIFTLNDNNTRCKKTTHTSLESQLGAAKSVNMQHSKVNGLTREIRLDSPLLSLHIAQVLWTVKSNLTSNQKCKKAESANVFGMN